MRLSTPFSLTVLAILAVPVLSTAELKAQKPLLENIQSWLSAAAQTYLPSAAHAYLPSAAKLSSILTSNIPTTPIASPEAVAAAATTTPITADDAAAAAAANITPLTTDNWRTVLSPSPSRASPDLNGRETWMVLVSGGNKTCLGQCGHLEGEWNMTAALIAADPLTAKTAPRLGYISCDASPVLCALWSARPVTLWHIQFPAVHVANPELADSESGSDSDSATTTSATSTNNSPPPSLETTVRIIPLNMTNTTAEDLLQIHTRKNYDDTPVYDGIFHPFDGLLVKTGVALPVAYLLAGFTLIPTWAYMIVVSFGSRTIM